MDTTHHAATRMQQRSISPLMVDLLLEFGSSQPAGDGTSKLFFDKRSRRKLQHYVGSMANRLEEQMNIYAVVGHDQRIITVGHRYKRILRE